MPTGIEFASIVTQAAEPGADPSRRRFLTALTALGAGALLPNIISAQAQQGRTAQGSLDFHHHYTSPAWVAMMEAQNRIRPVQGLQQIQDYTPARAIEAMDRGGVAMGLLSVTTPGVWFGNIDETRRAARELNEYAARMRSDYRGRFGQFAVLPLPDIDASLREIEYAFDTLGVDGVGLVTSYVGWTGNDTFWLGDPLFAPIWEELNRRNAIAYIHATAPGCCMWSHGTEGIRNGYQPHVGPTTIEFSTDTARSIVSIIESGTATRTPNVKYIWSHGGGTLFGARYLGADATAKSLAGTAPPNSKLHHLRRFYYDTAAANNPVHMGLMKSVIPMTQVLFGTDVPWGDPQAIVAGLENAGLTREELRGIYRENGLRIVPRYRA